MVSYNRKANCQHYCLVLFNVSGAIRAQGCDIVTLTCSVYENGEINCFDEHTLWCLCSKTAIQASDNILKRIN